MTQAKSLVNYMSVQYVGELAELKEILVGRV